MAVLVTIYTSSKAHWTCRTQHVRCRTVSHRECRTIPPPVLSRTFLPTHVLGKGHIYIHTCIHIHTYIRVYFCIYKYVYICMYNLCIFVCMRVYNVCAYTYVYMSIYMNVYMSICMYEYIYVCVHFMRVCIACVYCIWGRT